MPDKEMLDGSTVAAHFLAAASKLGRQCSLMVAKLTTTPLICFIEVSR